MHIIVLLSFQPASNLCSLFSHRSAPKLQNKSAQQDFDNLANAHDRSYQQAIGFEADFSFAMAKVCLAGPAVSTLDVFEYITYASTSTETMQVIEFFLEELKPIQAEDLEPEERNCYICTDDFRAGSHIAVRLPCNHHFGEECIQNWLRPYETPTKTKDEWEYGANSCPLCRQVFFPEQRNCDVLPEMEMRIKLWDKVFAYVGIALSEQEDRKSVV